MENAPDEPKELLRRVPDDSSGRKTHYPGLRRRLVELEDLHEKLQRSEAYWAEAQRLSHAGSFGWSVPAGGMSWSDETFRIFGYDPGVAPTLDLMLDRVHPEERNNAEQIIDRASRDGTDCNFENRLRLPDGTIKYVRIVALAVKNRAGGVEFVGAVTDITDRKRAEQALRRREAYLVVGHS